jgi:CDP-glycerol glycerophosphotransferase (TagB/SpsB family)
MQAHGVPAEKIRLTGNPSFDRLGQLDRLGLRKKFRDERAIPENTRVVAWISQPEPRKHPFSDLVGDPELPMQVEDALAAHFAQHPHVRIVIRMHPSETREKRSLGDHVSYSDSSESLDELLSGVDCVLTSGSTVGLEAAMLGTPVGQYTGSIFSDGLPLATMGLAEPVDTLFDLGRAVEGLFATKHGANPKVLALRQQVGNAAKNVADEICVLYFNSEK